MKKEDGKNNKSGNEKNISNVCGGITDSEFSKELINRPKKDRALFQFNFNGAELEKVNDAKIIDPNLK